MRGQAVCRMHGGKAPQNLAAAEVRLRELVHPAISALVELIAHADQDSVRLNASKYVLELAGFKATVEVKGDHEVVIRVIDEPQPLVIEQAYELNGRAHS
jgi:hypothetical protein